MHRCLTMLNKSIHNINQMNNNLNYGYDLNHHFKSIISVFTFSRQVKSINVSIARRVLFVTLCLLLLLTSKASVINTIKSQHNISKFCEKRCLFNINPQYKLQ